MTGVIGSRGGCARPPAFERIESLTGDPEKLGFGDLKMMGLNDGVVDIVAEQLESHILAERRTCLADETSSAGDRLDHALVLELRICLGDGVAVDAQLLGQWADRRK